MTSNIFLTSKTICPAAKICESNIVFVCYFQYLLIFAEFDVDANADADTNADANADVTVVGLKLKFEVKKYMFDVKKCMPGSQKILI